MNKLLDKLQSHLDANIPFAVYSKPETDAVTWIFQKSLGINYLESCSQRGFVFAPFNGEQSLIILAEDAEVISTVIDRNGVELSEPLQPLTDINAKNNFESLVANSVSAIRSGNFEKLVISRSEKVALSTDIAHILKNILLSYPTALRYCLYSPESGLWMGATPEQLLKANGNTITTVALAGTQLYRDGAQAIWPDKEQQEQKFVTDYILEELKPLVTNVELTPPHTFRAGSIVHIKTDIKAQLKEESSLKDVIDALHPTPAVCGLPKADSKKFLLENEGYDREYYSGYLGELNYDFAKGEDNRTDLFVNLRCMKIEGDVAHLFIGCGITKDSDPEKEFIETVNKSMTMRRVL